MTMSDTDQELLLRYSRQNEEDAFAELVRRHLNLVFCAALRQVRSPQLAEEVAQTVFTDLARQANRLAPDTLLTSWLYNVTRRTAIDVVRGETRRRSREQVAMELTAMNEASTRDWMEIESLLDEAMHELEDNDRTAVLLRYFENKSLRDVGQTLDISEDAARKRIARAIEELHTFFSKRGVTVAASGLVITISANAVQAAPVGLAAAISAAAVLAGKFQTSTVIAAMKRLALKAVQKPLTSAAVVAVLSAGILEARRISTLSGQNGMLHQQNAVLAQQNQNFQRERDDATSKLAALRDENETLNRNSAELLKLRGEVDRLKRELAEATTTKAPAEAQTSQPSEPNDALERQKRMARAKGEDALIYVYAFLDYAKHNQWQFPTNWTQVDPYLTNNPNQVVTGTNEFEMVYQGSLNYNDLGTNVNQAILIREYLAWPTFDGKWGKAYGFASGRSEIHVEPDGDFTTWEKQFMIPKPRSWAEEK